MIYLEVTELHEHLAARAVPFLLTVENVLVLSVVDRSVNIRPAWYVFPMRDIPTS